MTGIIDDRMVPLVLCPNSTIDLYIRTFHQLFRLNTTCVLLNQFLYKIKSLKLLLSFYSKNMFI